MSGTERIYWYNKFFVQLVLKIVYFNIPLPLKVYLCAVYQKNLHQKNSLNSYTTLVDDNETD